MSHFSLFVVGEDVDNQLIPFNESTSSLPKEFLTFNNTEDEYRKEYDNESTKEFYCSSSSSAGQEMNQELFDSISNKQIGEHVILSFDKTMIGIMKYFKNKEYYRCTKLNSKSEDAVWIKVTQIILTDHPDPDVCCEGVIRVERVAPPKDVPFKDKYPTFENFVEEYHGIDERDPGKGVYGYYSNPNAKWDWYQVGGRWKNFLFLKTGGYTDSAKKGDIDFEQMKNIAGEKALTEYNLFQFLFGHLPVNLSWEQVREKFGEGKIDEARDFYHKQDRVQAISKNETFKWKEVDDFLIPLNEYIENARKASVRTFAILVDGKWCERGEMGWFGCVSNEKAQSEWEDEFETILNSIPDGVTITVVDCHI